MSEDESYEKFLSRARFIFWLWFFLTPFMIACFVSGQALFGLSILVFVVIITWRSLLRIRKGDKENLSKITNIFFGREETKATSNKQKPLRDKKKYD